MTGGPETSVSTRERPPTLQRGARGETVLASAAPEESGAALFHGAPHGGLMRFRPAWLACLLLASFGVAAAPAAAPIPSIVTRDGHSALLVDGKPWLMLGAQVNNSSA